MTQQLIIPVFYVIGKDGNPIYDYEQITEYFEQELLKLTEVEEKEKEYKPYTNIDNIVNDMLATGGKKWVKKRITYWKYMTKKHQR